MMKILSTSCPDSRSERSSTSETTAMETRSAGTTISRRLYWHSPHSRLRTTHAFAASFASLTMPNSSICSYDRWWPCPTMDVISREIRSYSQLQVTALFDWHFQPPVEDGICFPCCESHLVVRDYTDFTCGNRDVRVQSSLLQQCVREGASNELAP